MPGQLTEPGHREDEHDDGGDGLECEGEVHHLLHAVGGGVGEREEVERGHHEAGQRLEQDAGADQEAHGADPAAGQVQVLVLGLGGQGAASGPPSQREQLRRAHLHTDGPGRVSHARPTTRHAAGEDRQ